MPGRPLEFEGAAGEIGQLGFRSQVIAQAHGVADHLLAQAAGIGEGHAPYALLGIAEDFQRGDAKVQRHPGAFERSHELHALPGDTRPRQQLGRRQGAQPQRRGIEHRGDGGPGLLVLAGDQVKQGPATQEDHPPADGHRLGLEGDLGAAEGIGARQVPARHRQQPVAGAGAEHQGVEVQGALAIALHGVEGALVQVPGHRLRTIVQPPAQTVEGAVQVFSLGRFAAVEGGIGALKTLGLAAIDLATVAAILVDHHRGDTRGQQGFGAAHAGRAGTDDDHARLGRLRGC